MLAKTRAGKATLDGNREELFAMDFDPNQYLELVSTNRHVQALLAIAAGLIGAFLADLIITRVVRGLTSRTRTELDDQILAALHRPVFTTVALIGLGIALKLEAPESIELYTGDITRTLITLVWLGFFWKLSTILINWMVADERRFQLIQPATAPLFSITTKLVVLGVSAWFILQTWEQDVTAWLASAGILGLAVGLAAQDTLGNLFAGVSILADVPYKVGDYIVLDDGSRGEVTRIGLRSTRILTRDQIEVTIPNSIIAQSRIVNESGGPSPQRRLRIPIGVAYGSDIDEVERILKRVAAEDPLISREPEPRIHFVNFGDSSLDFEIRCWMDDPELRGRVVNSMNRAIYKNLNAAQIEIPFPKRDVYVKEWPGRGDGEGG